MALDNTFVCSFLGKITSPGKNYAPRNPTIQLKMIYRTKQFNTTDG